MFEIKNEVVGIIVWFLLFFVSKQHLYMKFSDYTVIYIYFCNCGNFSNNFGTVYSNLYEMKARFLCLEQRHCHVRTCSIFEQCVPRHIWHILFAY